MELLKKSKLEKLYRNNPNKVVCEILGISTPTLMSYLKKLGIEPKGKGRRDSGRRGGKYNLIDDMG